MSPPVETEYDEGAIFIVELSRDPNTFTVTGEDTDIAFEESPWYKA
jgi:hypothetical protein